MDKYVMIKIENISKDFFKKINSRFSDLVIGDEDGTVTNRPEDARFFEFVFSDEGYNVGKVTASIKNEDDSYSLVLIFNKDFITNEDEMLQQKWYNFLKELRYFSKKRLMNFEIRNINKSNLKKSDYRFLAQTNSGDEQMNESKLYGTSKISYENIGDSRLVIKHNGHINQEVPGGRTKNINSIYIETSEGERFKYPYKHLNGARALAKHVSEGGNPYDDFGSHITEMSSELLKLRKFKTHVNRNSVMAENLSKYTDVVKERIEEIKSEIQKLQRDSYYKESIESFVKENVTEVPEDIKDAWIEELTMKTFNEDLVSIFPYLYKLVQERNTLGPDNLMDDKDPCWKGYKQIGMKKKNGKEVPNCVPKEEIELEQGFEEMMGQFNEKKGKDLDHDGDVDSDDYMKAKDIAIKKAMNKDEEEVKEKTTPLGEFILSYFDYTTGQFPKGETAILTMVEKDYGEEFIEPAKAFIERVNERVAEVMGYRETDFSDQLEDDVPEEDTEINDISRLAGL